MQEEKQIYAYSWRRDLIKKAKEYLTNARKSSSTTIIKPENAPEVILDASPAKTISKANLKEDKPTKNKLSKKQKYVHSESGLLVKEKREKILTQIIGGLILLIMGSGILIGSSVAKFPSSNTNSLNFISTSPTTSPPEETEVKITQSIQPTKTLSISPVVTKTPQSILPPQTNCKISGCNGEICADEGLGNVSTICLYQEKYTCYKNARCERQSNGSCSWTQDSELVACLDRYQ